jgi:hypothetical protein
MLIIVQWLLMSLIDQIRLKVKQNLEIAEVGVLRQIQNRLLLVNSALLVVADFVVVAFVVVDVHEALSNKEHLLNVSLITNNNLAWNVDPAEHVDDQIVGEAALALFKEVVKRLLKVPESSGALDQFGLHLGGDLLVELEFFDHEVEVIQESLLDIFPNVIVQCRLNVVRFVGFLDFLDPHIQRVQLFFDQVVEVVLGVEDSVNRAHQE